MHDFIMVFAPVSVFLIIIMNLLLVYREGGFPAVKELFSRDENADDGEFLHDEYEWHHRYDDDQRRNDSLN